MVSGKRSDGMLLNLHRVAADLQKFSGAELTNTLAKIEADVKGITADKCASVLGSAGINHDLLSAAATLKRLSGQINVSIHAAGILLCLPHIMEAGETVDYVSLGAGNTGRNFDLETNYRIAEFKFINWRGGSETIRQNQLFKDFFLLAESLSSKRKYLYVLGTEHPLKFLNGRRALATSVLTLNDRLLKQFTNKYGNQYPTVRDYFLAKKDLVTIEDMSSWVPELVSVEPAEDED